MTKLDFFGVSMLALIMGSPALAQDPVGAAQAGGQATQETGTGTDPAAADSGDDIIVTATKREQTLQDVPISVSVTGADIVEKAQIRDLIDLQSVVPSLKVTQFQSAGQTNFLIRGFGNGNGNDGIESSVGVFIDGVYRSRSASALDDLPEIERVEVLRGPQSTLFGKNVSAGAISIVTRKPQFDFGMKAEISLGNYGQINPRLTVTGPISETVAVRLSGSVNQRDGYFTNVVTSRDVNDRNRFSLRGDIVWEPSADLSVRVIGDYNHINEVCCGAVTVFNGPSTLAIGALGFRINDTSDIFSRDVVFSTDPNNRLTGKGLSGQVDWNVGFAKLTSITAYRTQTNRTTLDVDFTGADISNQTTANKIKTFTQEVRLASDNDGPLSWLIGGFYQDERLDTGRDIRFGKDGRAFINAITGQTATSPGLVTILESLQAATGSPVVPGRTYFAPGQGISDFYSTKQRSYSLFGQVDFEVTDRLTLTGGAAYLNDRKKAASNVVLSDPFSSLNLENVPGLAFIPFATPTLAGITGCLLQKGYAPGATLPVNLFGATLGSRLPGPGSTPCPASPAGVNPFALTGAQFFYAGTPNHAPVNFPNANESGILKGDKITYAARAAYDFDVVNAYVSYSTGWKAGAFNLSSDSRPPNAAGIGRTARPESVTVYEAGLKASFRGGFLNVAVFKQQIKNFQSNPFNGVGFDLINAGKESVRGAEVDASYRPIPWLSLTGAVTYLDPKYDSFTGAACVNYDPVCNVDPSNGLRTRDLSGQTPAGIPKWSASVSAVVSHDFGDGLSGYIRGEYDYQSNTQTSETTPPNLSTFDVNTVNASISMLDASAQLEVMAWVRNLTNDNYLLSNFPTVIQTGSYSGYPNQPRTYGVTLRKTF